MITVHYSSIDGFSKSLECETLDVARNFAQHRVGATPEIGSSYAVSSDGVGKVTVEGCALAELFAERAIGMARVCGMLEEGVRKAAILRTESVYVPAPMAREFIALAKELEAEDLAASPAPEAPAPPPAE